MSFELRLQALEAVVAKMTSDQGHLSSVKALISKTPHLSDISRVLKQYDRKLKALTHALSVNKNLVKSLKQSFPRNQQKKEAHISTVVKRRNRQINTIEAKIPYLEDAFSALQKSDEKANEHIESRVKSDINGLIVSTQKENDMKNNASLSQLKNCSQKIKLKSSIMMKLSAQIHMELHTFARDNRDRLANIEPPEMYDPATYEGIVSMADFLAQRAKPGVSQQTSVILEKYNVRFKEFAVFCSKEILKFRGELQLEKEKNMPALKNSTKTDVMLNSSLEVIRSNVKYANYFVNPGFNSLNDIASIYTESEEIILHKNLIGNTRQQLAAFEKKLQESNAVIDELLGKANGFAKSCKNKKLPAKLKTVEKEVMNFRATSKECLVKAKTKIDAVVAQLTENQTT